MRGVARSWFLALGLWAGCAPDYAHTAFRCGGDHGCPPGQHCSSGRCRRSDPAGDGVRCGSAACDPTQQCCADPPSSSCGSAGDVCPGTSALCDGPEDCQAPERCCAHGSTVACDEGCDRVVCHADADCPLAAPSCCASEDGPWKECSAPGC